MALAFHLIFDMTILRCDLLCIQLSQSVQKIHTDILIIYFCICKCSCLCVEYQSELASASRVANVYHHHHKFDDVIINTNSKNDIFARMIFRMGSLNHNYRDSIISIYSAHSVHTLNKNTSTNAIKCSTLKLPRNSALMKTHNEKTASVRGAPCVCVFCISVTTRSRKNKRNYFIQHIAIS